MEVGRVCVWGGLGKCYLPFLSLINVKNNGALVVHQPHSTWFWFTSPAEETACSKLVPGRRTATSPHHCFHRFAILSSSAPNTVQTRAQNISSSGGFMLQKQQILFFQLKFKSQQLHHIYCDKNVLNLNFNASFVFLFHRCYGS